MTRTIHFKGKLGELFGEKHRLNCKTITEAVHAIDTMKGGLRRYLMECTDLGIHFTVQKGETFLDPISVGVDLGKDDLIVTPVPAGSNALEMFIGILITGIGIVTGNPYLIGVGASMALKGIVDLLTPDAEETEDTTNNLFNGPENATKSGIPIPLAYGKMQVGGAVINFGFTNDRVKSVPGGDFTFVSKGTNNTNGFNNNNDDGQNLGNLGEGDGIGQNNDGVDDTTNFTDTE